MRDRKLIYIKQDPHNSRYFLPKYSTSVLYVKGDIYYLLNGMTYEIDNDQQIYDLKQW